MSKKPVNCGCGGEATVDCYLGGLDKNDLYYVYCPECNIQTANYLIEAEAIEAWNRAMGAKDINVPNKERTAKVKEGWGLAVCECGRRVFEGDIYCSRCGAKLDWGKDE